MMNKKEMSRLALVITKSLRLLSIKPQTLYQIPTTRTENNKNIWNVIANKYYNKKNRTYTQDLHLRLLWNRNSYNIQKLVYNHFNDEIPENSCYNESNKKASFTRQILNKEKENKVILKFLKKIEKKNGLANFKLFLSTYKNPKSPV